MALEGSRPEQTIKIGSDLEDSLRVPLLEFLRRNTNCFAWTYEDMVGIDLAVVTHKLNVDPAYPPVRQKRWKFAAERNKIVDAEVQNLLQTGKIREVKYPEWLVNVVVVQKKNGKWRVCVDFIDLNKAYLKDSSIYHILMQWSTLLSGMKH